MYGHHSPAWIDELGFVVMMPITAVAASIFGSVHGDQSAAARRDFRRFVVACHVRSPLFRVSMDVFDALERAQTAGGRIRRYEDLSRCAIQMQTFLTR